jgi:hypothetical protein
LKKVVSDRRASLDEETEIRPTVRKLVESEFERGASIPAVYSPVDSMAIQDAPRLAPISVCGPIVALTQHRSAETLLPSGGGE